MNKKIQNEGCVLTENVFIGKGEMEIYGWYGLDYFEISDKTGNLSRKDIYDLRDCLNEMIKEIEKIS